MHNAEVAGDRPCRAPRTGEKPQRCSCEVELDAHIRVDQGGNRLFDQAGVVGAEVVVACSVAARNHVGYGDFAEPGGVEAHGAGVGVVGVAFDEARGETGFGIFARGQRGDQPTVAQPALTHLGDAGVQRCALTDGGTAETWLNGGEVFQKVGKFRFVGVDVIDQSCARSPLSGEEGVEVPEVGPD